MRNFVALLIAAIAFTLLYLALFEVTKNAEETTALPATPKAAVTQAPADRHRGT
ncbi:MAG TPA: hypothetical protein VMU79_06225 [Casimicrobiaceae bacterium]|jgi:hypothetical protein|nr:hypothetical protein [Casimicrobiaceae bacterium]